MRQVWITRAGGPSVLEVRQAPDPAPAPGQVRIRVAAAGVNFADVLARMGLYPDAPPLPTVVGYEVAGVIDRLGDGVVGHALGDRVVCMTRFGGYADAVVVPADQVVEAPARLDLVHAAAIPVNYLTAWVMLVHRGNVQQGETVLVHSAGGGVGLAALQIARLCGARVIGTASAGKHERLRAAGAAHCIDYRSEDFEQAVMRLTDGRGVDVVLDPIGGKSFRKSYRCLAPLGRLFAFGGMSMATSEHRSLVSLARTALTMPRFHPVSMIDDNRGVFGINMGRLWDERAAMRALLERIVAHVQSGALDPVLARTFPFEAAGEAHAYLQARQNFGKVVLVPERA